MGRLKAALVALGARRAKRGLEAVAETLDPALRVALRGCPPPPPLALVAVYRRHNAATVRRLLDGLPAGSAVALWALDDPAPALEVVTCGSGPGGRMELLNRCVTALPERAGEWLVVCDDDVAFRRGGVGDLLRVGRAAGLDLFQPAHSYFSNFSWDYTRRRLLGVARRGRFVEIGPLFALSPRGRELVLPLYEASPFGWGVEALWASLESRGLRLGIVDAVLVDHLMPFASHYEAAPERERERALAASVGIADLRELQHDHERWTLTGPPRLA